VAVAGSSDLRMGIHRVNFGRRGELPLVEGEKGPEADLLLLRRL
jgi:hypothetical protein